MDCTFSRITTSERSPTTKGLRVLTIREAFDQFYLLNHPDLAPRTILRYRDEILRWERLSANPLIDAMTTETFNRFRAACLAAGLKATTIEGGIRTILQVLRLCGPEQERRQGLGLISRVPYIGRPLRAHVAFQPTPTVEQLRLCYIFANIPIWPRVPDRTSWWRAWIGLSFVTGLRLSDMLTLPTASRQGDLLIVTAGKTATDQVFVLPPWLLLQVDKLPSHETLFGCPRLPCFIRREFRRMSNKLGLQPITPHGIRRACITEWSAINSDCGRVIHGEGLRMRSRYVAVDRLLRRHIGVFPDLSRIE